MIQSVDNSKDVSSVSEKQQHQLYQQAMLAHHKAPVGFAKTIDFTHSAQGDNPACGDEIELQLHIAQGRIQSAAFHGDSCAICRASASMLCQHIEGQTVEQAQTLGQQIRVSIKDNVAFIGEFAEKFSPLMSVQKFPVRKQCALLPWTTMQQILNQA